MVKRNEIVRLKMRNARRGEWMETNRETKWAVEFLPWSGLVSKEGIKGSGGSKWDLEGRSTAGEGQTKLLGGGEGGLDWKVNEVKRCDGIVKKVGVIADLAWRWQRVVLPLQCGSVVSKLNYLAAADFVFNFTSSSLVLSAFSSKGWTSVVLASIKTLRI